MNGISICEATGVVSFGPMSFPVKIYASTRKTQPHLRRIHGACGGRIRWRGRCVACNRAVSRDEMEYGYEVGRDEYVALSREELAVAAGSEQPGSIEVVQAVRVGEIAQPLLGKSYWVVPSGTGDRPFALLRDTLLATQRIAVTKAKFPERTYLATLRSSGPHLILTRMRYADELLAPIAVSAVPIAEKELRAGLALLEELTAPWDPSRFANEYRQRIETIAERRIGHGAVRRDSSVPPPSGTASSKPLTGRLMAFASGCATLSGR